MSIWLFCWTLDIPCWILDIEYFAFPLDIGYHCYNNFKPKSNVFAFCRICYFILSGYCRDYLQREIRLSAGFIKLMCNDRRKQHGKFRCMAGTGGERGGIAS